MLWTQAVQAAKLPPESGLGHMIRLLLLSACTLLTMAGCAPAQLRGNGFGDTTATWGRQLRPTTQPGELQGFDTRAREIEQNLGVR
jgi:hypothetical protein